MKMKETKKVAKTKVKAKTKVTTTQEKATPAKVAVAARTSLDVATDALAPAPWNPRGKITPESVADLVGSITSMGIIEPVVAMRGAGGKYIIIAGHRRVAAAKIAGLATIPCDVLAIDEAQARRMTFIENLQRKDADPLLESTLIGNLIADGMSQAEIAAETGRGEKWVARRKNLTNLSPSWRKRVASGEKITTDCLEHIAAYPEATQEKLKHLRRNYSGTVHWDDVSWEFKRETRDLTAAVFDTSPCRTCPKNTGCTPDLFDWQNGKPATLGKCMDEKCYKQHLSDFVAKLADKAKAEGTTVYRHEPSLDADSQSRRDKNHTDLYIYTDYNKELKVEWGRPKGKSKTSAAADDYQEKIAAERKEKRERNKAIRKLAEWCGGGTAGEPCNLAKLLDEHIGRHYYQHDTAHVSPLAVFAIQHLFDFVGWPGYKLIGTDTEVRHCAISAIFGNLSVPDNWTCKVAAEVITSLNPSRSGGWQAERNAILILRMLGADAAVQVGADIVAAIIPKDDDAKKFCNPQVKWLGDDETVSDFDEPDIDDDETGGEEE